MKGHGFSRADRLTLVIQSAASRFAWRIKMRSRRPALSEAEGTPALPHLCITAARHSPPVRVGRTLLSAAVALDVGLDIATTQPTGAPSFRVLCERVGLHTADTKGFAGNQKPETRNRTLRSTVSGHGFSRAVRLPTLIKARQELPHYLGLPSARTASRASFSALRMTEGKSADSEAGGT